METRSQRVAISLLNHSGIRTPYATQVLRLLIRHGQNACLTAAVMPCFDGGTQLKQEQEWKLAGPAENMWKQRALVKSSLGMTPLLRPLSLLLEVATV